MTFIARCVSASVRNEAICHFVIVSKSLRLVAIYNKERNGLLKKLCALIVIASERSERGNPNHWKNSLVFIAIHIVDCFGRFAPSIRQKNRANRYTVIASKCASICVAIYNKEKKWITKETTLRLFCHDSTLSRESRNEGRIYLFFLWIATLASLARNDDKSVDY